MIISVIKEIKNNENRVGLTPAGSEALVRAGHTVHEIKYNLLNTVGIGYRHKAVLKKYAKQIK